MRQQEDGGGAASGPGRVRLVIDSLSADDAATFVCRASNEAGDNEATAAIIVNCTYRHIDRQTDTHTHTASRVMFTVCYIIGVKLVASTSLGLETWD